MVDSDSARFHPLFERWARRVRRRLLVRHVLSGAAVGLLVGVVVAALAYKSRHDVLRKIAPVTALFGAGGGLFVAHRRRWSDTDIALYLDECLATDEVITTA